MSDLNCDFYIQLPLKLISLLDTLSNYIIKVMKSFYDVLEVGNYWFVTYHTYYKENFEIIVII